MKLTWERTLIGGQTKPYDFAAKNGDANVGRVYRHDTSGREHHWYWAMNASGPNIYRHGVNCSGLVDTKEDAVRMVEETYAVCLKRPDAP